MKLERDEVMAAPVLLRGVAGLLDLAIEAGLVIAALWAWWRAYPLDLPPRYWNAFDYAIDLANGQRYLLIRGAVLFAIVHVVWQTLWSRLIGAAPVARLMGMRVVTTRGRQPGLVRLCFRAGIALPLALFGLLGPLWAFVSPRRRMLHDVLTGCELLRGPVTLSGDLLGSLADTERRPAKPFAASTQGGTTDAK